MYESPKTLLQLYGKIPTPWDFALAVKLKIESKDMVKSHFYVKNILSEKKFDTYAGKSFESLTFFYCTP